MSSTQASKKQLDDDTRINWGIRSGPYGGGGEKLSMHFGTSPYQIRFLISQDSL